MRVYKNNDVINYSLGECFLYKGIIFKTSSVGPYILRAKSLSKIILFEKIIFEQPLVKFNKNY